MVIEVKRRLDEVGKSYGRVGIPIGKENRVTLPDPTGMMKG